MDNYHKEYRKKNMCIYLWLRIRFYTRIKKQAEKHNMTIPAFVKECLDSYLNQSFVTPYQEELQTLIMQVRKAATNINQIAAKVNATGMFSHKDQSELRSQIETIESNINSILTQPSEVIKWLETKIKENPALKTQLVEFAKNLTNQS